MGTMTAQILIGGPHPNHDGIQPTHYLFLSENGGPGWVLVPENLTESSKGGLERITWIPTVSHMLEDAFLMIAIHVLQDEEICRLAKKSFSNEERGRVELFDDIDPVELEGLRKKCRDLPNWCKLIISVFDGSTVCGQLGVIDKYRMDVEVCTCTYCRLYSRWTDEVQVRGKLT